MRLKYTIMTLFLALSNYSQGQFLHTPEEMEEKVLGKPEKYLLQETENLSPEAFENCRSGIEKHNEQVKPGSENNILVENLSKANRKKLKKKNKRIIKQVAYESNIDVISELALNHYQLGNFDEALYYKLQLAAPSQTFEDEFFLAKSYFETKKYDTALNHIFNAKVYLPYSLGSNNTTEKLLVENLLSKILAAKKQDYQNWNLEFSYCITNRDDKVFISFKSEPWKAYAICKSVWLEDAEHRAKMALISDQPTWLVEEKECLLNTLVAHMRHEGENTGFEGINHLAAALDENTVKEFILYEKFISQYQPIPEGLPTKVEILNLKTYFLKAHTAKL